MLDVAPSTSLEIALRQMTYTWRPPAAADADALRRGASDREPASGHVIGTRSEAYSFHSSCRSRASVLRRRDTDQYGLHMTMAKAAEFGTLYLVLPRRRGEKFDGHRVHIQLTQAGNRCSSNDDHMLVDSGLRLTGVVDEDSRDFILPAGKISDLERDRPRGLGTVDLKSAATIIHAGIRNHFERTRAGIGFDVNADRAVRRRE